MGTAINVECGKCKYNGSFMLGTGQYYVLVENCLEALPEAISDEVNALLKKHPIKDFTFEYKLYQCDNDDCLFLFDSGNLEITFEDGETYLNQIECPSCEKDMSHQNTLIDQLYELACPSCHSQGEVTLAGEMEWD